MAQDEKRLSLRSAIGISAALHLLLAPFFLSLPLFMGTGTSTTGGLAFDRQSVVTTLTIVHRRKARHDVAAKVAHAPRPTHPEVVAHRRIAPPRAVRDAALPGAVSEGVVKLASAPRVIRAEGGPAAPSAVPGTPQPAVEAQGAIVPTPAPTPSPVPTLAAAAVAVAPKAAPDRGSDASAGGWGQNFDSPIADESELADLKAKYHIGRVTIQVDENGHAVRVQLPANVGADVRDEVLQRLNALHYIPAECNGLRCAGTLVLTL